MCGIFGYLATKDGDSPNINLLKMMADENTARGGDSHGISQVIGDDIVTFRSPGSFSDNLDALEWCEGAKAVIGHTRFSTSGTWEENKNNQPLFWGDQTWKKGEGENAKTTTVPKMSMVHNGTLRNYSELKKKWRCESLLKSECDSEIIGYMARCFHASGQEFGKAIIESAKQLQSSPTVGGPPLALLFLYNGKMWTYRNGNPTYWYHGDSGIYFSSIEFDSKYKGNFGEQPEGKVYEYSIMKDNRKPEDLKMPQHQPLEYARSQNKKIYTSVQKEHGRVIYPIVVQKLNEYPTIGDDEFVSKDGNMFEFVGGEMYHVSEPETLA